MSELETENHSVCPSRCNPMDCTVHGILDAHPPQPPAQGSDPGLPHSLPAELQGKPSELEGELVTTGLPQETPEHGV